ncbi:hypothetical protein HPB51_017334 [Rhipicephalus microplus]|uniref:GTP-binding protein Rhes n=1 Tax=Rhipicephalus microplus TaxID=6941 RepID=A0A9J6EU73_RHIMP|nr:hypothetical protein HPB51_017334 [Rhipicephalus microplus]
MSPHGSLRGRSAGTGSFLSVTGSHEKTSSSASVSPDASATNKYRLVVLGGPRVGKSAIVHRFLHDRFLHDYSATVEEFHRGEYDVGGGATVALDILDTGGSFEFPAMRRLAIDSGAPYKAINNCVSKMRTSRNADFDQFAPELLAQAHFKSKVAKATQSRRMSLPVNSFSRDQLSPVFRPKGARKRTSCAVS